MFHTLPEAEFPLPRGLAQNGLRAWQWIEFGLCAPHLLVSLDVCTKDGGSLGRTLLFDNLQMLQALVKNPGDDVRIRQVAVLSPDWLNGSGGYQLDEARQVWADEWLATGEYVLANGTKYGFPLGDDADTEGKVLHLVWSA